MCGTIVSKRCAKMKVRCIQGCPNKVAILEDLRAEFGVSWEEIAYLGNDINDTGCLERVGLPMVVADAYEEVTPLARYQTKVNGGYGAVREVCDIFYHVRVRKLEV